VLVGDSAAMVVLGHDVDRARDRMTSAVLTRASHARARRPLVIADMPFGSFQAPTRRRSRTRPLRQGGRAPDAVKLEGAGPDARRASSAIVGAAIPVMGHVGLTPAVGDDARRLQGDRAAPAAKAERLYEDALALERPAASRSCSRRCPRRSRAG
jgi:3-methyl-2-oxobutanoate hydroxymethyltransferase